MKRWILYWVAVCALAELAGFATAALWWVLVDQVLPDPALVLEKAGTLGLKALAGVPEGLILGWAQVGLLRRRAPGLRRAPFIGCTILVAVLGWAGGSAVPIFLADSVVGSAPAAEPGIAAMLVGTAAAGLVSGLLFGVTQALALRGVFDRVVWWVLGNAAGWAVGLPITYLAASQGDASAPLCNALIYGLPGGLAVGAWVGAATAMAAAMMRPRAHQPCPRPVLRY